METSFSPQVKELMKANGGDLFYDSHSSDRGSPDELWTNKMAEEFSKRRQYPLIPNLPALFREYFEFNDGSAPRVRNDFYAVRGDIWIEKQIAATARLGSEVQQPCSACRWRERRIMIIPITDMVLAAAAVDRPEHEEPVRRRRSRQLSADGLREPHDGQPLVLHGVLRGPRQELRRRHFRMPSSTCTRASSAASPSWCITSIPTAMAPPGNGPAITTSARRDSPTPGARAIPTGWTRALYNDYLRAEPAGSHARRRQDRCCRLHAELSLSAVAGYQVPRHWGDLKLQEAGYTRDYLNPTMLESAQRDRDGKASRRERARVQGADHRQRAGAADAIR